MVLRRVAACDRVKVIGILGTNFSGSHLLAHLLNAHSECVAIGELHRYDQLMKTGGSVSSTYRSDPFFRDLGSIEVRNRHNFLHARACLDYSIENPLLIDVSKKTDWFDAQSGPVEMYRYIHLIRDPRALAFRWQQTYDHRQQRRQRLRIVKRMRSPGLLFASFPLVCANKWLRENRIISHFLKSRSASLITYHSLVFSTEESLQSLMAQIGRQYEVEQLQFGEQPGLFRGTFKTDYYSKMRRSLIEPDLRWQQGLAPEVRSAIESDTDIVTYLLGLGLKMAKNGLVPIDDHI